MSKRLYSVKALKQSPDQLRQAKTAILEELGNWKSSVLTTFHLTENAEDDSIHGLSDQVRSFVARSMLRYYESVMLLSEECV